MVVVVVRAVFWVRGVRLVRVVLLVRVVWRGCVSCYGVRGWGRLGEEGEAEAATLGSGEEENEDVETQKLRPLVELEV